MRISTLMFSRLLGHVHLPALIFSLVALSHVLVGGCGDGGGRRTPALTANIVASDATAVESGDTGEFTITLSRTSSSDITVGYSVTGTATGGVDYIVLSGAATIPSGKISVSISVAPLNDGAVVESHETIIVTLIDGNGYSLGSPDTATVILQDDDVAATIVASDEIASETGPDTGLFTISLSDASASDTIVYYSVGGTADNGIDYVESLSGSVTITAGQTDETFVITPVDDEVLEATETVNLTLSPDTSYVIGAPDSATVFISDNEPVTYSIGGTVSGAIAAGVTVSLSGDAILSTTTSGGGAYSFSGLSNGTYSVSASLEGYTFSPQSHSVTIADSSSPNNDFSSEVHPVVYVNAAATGTGTGRSWENAFTDLQDGIDAAEPGEEVWVAAGTYKPTSWPRGGALPREKHFSLRNDIAVYGGFAGNETALEQRDPSVNQTVCSGDFNGDDIISGSGETLSLTGISENAYHVFYHPTTGAPVPANLDSSAILDGFIISGGYADGDGTHASGGGIYNDHSSPTIRNCTFTGNSAINSGAGMYNTYDASPNIADCIFSKNAIAEPGSTSGGGGIFNDYVSGTVISGCTFYGNHVISQGGGIFSQGAHANITNCTFTDNYAADAGGAIYDKGGGTNSGTTVSNCTLTANTARDNGGGAIYAANTTIISGCVIADNVSSLSNGGGVYGGWIYDSQITNNQAQRGGGIANAAIVERCTLSGNSAAPADGEGGGLYGCPFVIDCTINNNTAFDGGGLSNCVHITNCTISSNSATRYAGGILNSGSNMKHCTLSGNSAGDSGGALYSASSSANIANCIFWGNSSEIGELSSSLNVSYSVVQGGYAGTNIITTDPLLQALADNGGQVWTMALASGSSAINAADSTYGPATDARGYTRVGQPDIGAYEANATQMSNTYVIKDIYPGASSALQDRYGAAVDQTNGILYFRADNGADGVELWKTDGTAVGTVMVKDLNPDGYGHIEYSPLTQVVGTTVFFSGSTDGSTSGLYKSDGTAAGTVLLKSGLSFGLSWVVGDKLIFTADDQVNGQELWISDGTPSGTTLIKDIYPGYSGSIYLPCTATVDQTNGILYFPADNGVDGLELWKTDGTAVGTVMVKDLNPAGSGYSSSYPLTQAVGTTVFFSGTTDGSTSGLYKSDGTPEGTVLLKENLTFVTNWAFGDQLISESWVVGNKLIFAADDGINGQELWISDGTVPGTTLLKDIYPGASGSGAYAGAVDKTNGILYFHAKRNEVDEMELWKTDGTPGGTVMIQDLNPGGSAHMSAYPLTQVVGTTVYFSGSADGSTSGLYRSDGTAAGTVFLQESLEFGESWVVGDKLIFSANDWVIGQELWISF